MTNVNLEFYGLEEMEGCITVNDKFIDLKRNKEGGHSCTVQCERNECNIIIYKGHKYIGKNWIWWNLLYFFLSVFGIFDTKQNKQCLVYDARFNIICNSDTKIIIRKQNFVDGGKVVNVETDCRMIETANVQFYDVKGQKRHSRMKLIKILATAILVILITGFIILI